MQKNLRSDGPSVNYPKLNKNTGAKEFWGKTSRVPKDLSTFHPSVKCPKLKKSYGQIFYSTIRTLVQKSIGAKRPKCKSS